MRNGWLKDVNIGSLSEAVGALTYSEPILLVDCENRNVYLLEIQAWPFPQSWVIHK